MPMCSICSRGEETANFVNQMLDEQTELKEIARQTGLGFRSISRHKRNRYRKNCPFGYVQHKLDKVKVKRDGQTRRVVVQWMMDGGKLTTVNKNFSPVADPRFSLPVAPNELRKDDILVCVEFENLPTRKPRDPVKPEN